METGKMSREDLVMRAKRLDRYCELLIEQCDNWLAAPDYEYKETLWGQRGVARKRGEPSDQKSK
jgi:hypothetical protein